MKLFEKDDVFITWMEELFMLVLHCQWEIW